MFAYVSQKKKKSQLLQEKTKNSRPYFTQSCHKEKNEEKPVNKKEGIKRNACKNPSEKDTEDIPQTEPLLNSHNLQFIIIHPARQLIG